MNLCHRRRFVVIAALVLAASCGDGSVNSEDSARRAYLGLDRAVDVALGLGMAGFNAASSANIPEQQAMGQVSGTLTVTGQVDQGSSVNKGMRLRTAFAMYRDLATDGDGGAALALTYATDAANLPALTLSLRDIPNGTLTGTWTGPLTMSGDLDGTATLNLSFAGQIRTIPGGTGIERTPGSTTITGTVTSRYGTYAVNLTR